MSRLRFGAGVVAGALAILVALTSAAFARRPTNRVWFPRDVLALGYATNLGPADPSQVMQIGIGLKDPKPGAEAALANAQQNPASPRYEHFLTPAQFDSRFGVSNTAAGDRASSSPSRRSSGATRTSTGRACRT